MRPPKGFTLLELLFAIGLLSLLVLVLSMVFSQGLRALHTGYERAEVHSAARQALDQMLREIPGAVSGSDKYPLVGFASPTLRTDGVGPELYFMGQVEGAGKGEVAELGYWLRDSGNASIPNDLMRFFVTDEAASFELYDAPGFTPDYATGSSNLLAERVRALRILYHYRTAPDTWAGPATSWDSRLDNVANVDRQGIAKNPDGLPDAIEMQMDVIATRASLRGDDPKTISIFIPIES